MLFITATRVGDAVLSMGLLNHFIEKHPGIQITIACGPVAAPLFEAVPGLERLVVLEKKPLSMHWPQFWRSCFGHIWDVLVDLRGSPISFTVFARERYRRGDHRSLEHRVRQLAAVVNQIDNPPAPKIWTNKDHQNVAERYIPNGGPVLAIGPTANWAAKIWPGEKFSELIRRMTGPEGIMPGARVAIFGADNERPIAQSVIDSVPQEKCIDLLGKIDLLSISACLERCALYIGNDSGLMHIAAASGVPTLGLFGPSQDVYYTPWGCDCDVVRSVPYMDIFPADFDHRTSGTLMESLSVEAVEDAAQRLWQRAGEGVA